MRHDHFTRPVQSDRMRHDYGNTRLDRDAEFTIGTMVLGLVSMAALGFSAIFILVAFGG